MEGAPGTKGLMMLSAAASLGSQIHFDDPLATSLSSAFSSLGATQRLFRLVLSQFAFSNVGSLLFGMGILYNFRAFERRMGTSKLVTYASMATFMSVTVQLALVIYFPSTFSRFSSGPYAIIFSLFVRYFSQIPKLQRIPFSGFEFSEKSVMYLMGIQLALIEGSLSFIPSLIGFTAGVFLSTPYLPLRNIQMPQWLSKFGERYLSPILESSAYSATPTVLSNSSSTAAATLLNNSIRNARTQASFPQYQSQGTANRNSPHQRERLVGSTFPGLMPTMNIPPNAYFPTSEPSDANINTLTEMGYSREESIRALRENGNNLQRATESLLNQS